MTDFESESTVIRNSSHPSIAWRNPRIRMRFSLTKGEKTIIIGAYIFCTACRAGRKGARDEMRYIRLTLGAALLFGALFVVLPGVGKLFAQESTVPQQTSVARTCEAVLVSGSACAQGEQVARERADSHLDAAACVQQETEPRAGVDTDANGNVVTAPAYYRSVPEAFAPGDAKT